MPVVAWAVWRAGPPEKAQARAFAFARRFEDLAGLAIGRKRLIPIRAHVMNALISRFCSLQPGFPVAFDLVGDGRAAFEREHGRGVLIATVHTKLGLILNAALRIDRRGPVFVGFPIDQVGDLAASSWGSTDAMEFIDARDPTVFLKIDAALKGGRTVVVFLDFGKWWGNRSYVSSNLFGWAERANVPVMYSLATVGRDDSRIRVELAAENPSLNGAAARAGAFADFLAERLSHRFRVCRPKELARQAGITGAIGAQR